MDVWTVDEVGVATGGGDMERGEECTEEVVEGDLEGIQPFLAVVQLKGWVLFWSLGKGED